MSVSLCSASVAARASATRLSASVPSRLTVSRKAASPASTFFDSSMAAEFEAECRCGRQRKQRETSKLVLRDPQSQRTDAGAGLGGARDNQRGALQRDLSLYQELSAPWGAGAARKRKAPSPNKLRPAPKKRSPTFVAPPPPTHQLLS